MSIWKHGRSHASHAAEGLELREGAAEKSGRRTGRAEEIELIGAYDSARGRHPDAFDGSTRRMRFECKAGEAEQRLRIEGRRREPDEC